MFEAWGWIDREWVKGWDCGTLRKMTVFFVGESKPYESKHFLHDYEVDYGKEKPKHTAEAALLIKQTVEVI